MEIKPKLRVDAYYDIQSHIVAGLERVATEYFIYRSCLTCEYFNEKAELCKLANQRPPARVIVFGCPKWVDVKEIPF